MLLSRAGRAKKRQLTDIGKLGARDAWQVLANGGVAAVCALFAWTMHSAPAAAAFAGAFAAASADTWGTEIGTLASGRPRSILTFQPIDTGLSGGVTFAGTFAEFIGAVLVAIVAWALGAGAFWVIAAGGIAGAFADSIIGASVQELRYCSSCDRRCEVDPHGCGTPTSIVRGAAWMNNDAVNVSATLVGAALAGFLTYIKL